MPYHASCYVVQCQNTWRNSDVKYFYFPRSQSKVDQRIKWINAIRRINSDKSQWTPKSTDMVCSAHFIGNVKSSDPLNPNYVPTIFPEVYKRKKNFSAQNRYKRLMNRRTRNISNLLDRENVNENDDSNSSDRENDVVEVDEEINVALDIQPVRQTVDVGCQVFMEDSSKHKTSSKIYGGRKSDSQISVESGILVLLEDRDVILADKGFPEVKASIDERGKMS
ncbi:uncharacterized protein LOC114341036 [Diabrotica virgifera virgifera]|uniref:Uncharacterized protein LOC114341036 n=1 Tax=Diabrotica virgifera virgifera TaxID=50390 RepID=A0A6P7GDS7_DIAVI|nr:uncharacterized protein LOC114341036 [Diabrotica virgifera virgifera]